MHLLSCCCYCSAPEASSSLPPFTTTHDFYSKCIVKQKPDFWQEVVQTYEALLRLQKQSFLKHCNNFQYLLKNSNESSDFMNKSLEYVLV